MARRRTSMKKVKEIIRLSHKKLSHREIAASVGIGKSTVSDTLKKLKESNIELREVLTFSEDQILKLLYPPNQLENSEEQKPDWKHVASQLAKKGVTRRLLWCEYRESAPEGLSYSQFCRDFREWKKHSKLPMVFDYEPGDCVFIDFSGLTVPYFCPTRNEVFDAEIFVGTLGYSGYTFVLACESQKRSDWLDAHTKLYEFLGGVPVKTIPDNLKSAVSKPCRYEPELNPSYRELAVHYGTCVIPARSGKPKDKARVEKAVQDIQTAILAKLRNLTFTSVYEINEMIAPLNREFNTSKFQRFDFSRQDLFEDEKAEFTSLPQQRFELAEWKTVKVNIDYHFEYDGHYYSVPYQNVGESIEARCTKTSIEAYLGGARIAVHPRSYKKARHSTIPNHMPKNHQKHVEWTPERILSWAKSLGTSVGLICKNIIAAKVFPEQAYRSCLGIIRLGDKYGTDNLEKACSYGLTLGSSSYTSIKSILETKSYLRQNEETTPKTPILEHDNIRGGNYYH